MPWLTGTVNVAAAGTRAQFATSTAPYNTVIVRARPLNGSTVYVGDVTVTSTLGVQLKPGEGFTFSVGNRQTVKLSEMYADSDVSADKVDYFAKND
ncbi:MAG: hypothetical protein Q8O40_16305 [Chloroflexota bacterium]|nr:hypothetical protein [Chloroflexota bacterium]